MSSLDRDVERWWGTPPPEKRATCRVCGRGGYVIDGLCKCCAIDEAAE